MAIIKRFDDIEAWQTARELTRQVNNLTGHGQFVMDYVLSNKMQRASISIKSNIAEGFESRTNILLKDYPGWAKASTRKLRLQAYVASDVGYIDNEEFSNLFKMCDECSRHLTRFIDYPQHQPQSVRDHGIEYSVST
jgi:four helix bundle protein